MDAAPDSIPRSLALPPVLAGLRIVEITAFVAAPLSGLTLAQLGADVVRVDPPGGNLDIHRSPLSPEGRSLYWASLNRGKRSVEIDYRRREGRELVRRLLGNEGDGGGILVTNLPLKDELDDEALLAWRRDLIVVRLTGSPDGRSELDYTVNCAVGFPLITGHGGEAPVNHVLPAWDALAGLSLAIAVLSAERQRRATGRGQVVRLALSDVAMSTVGNLGYIADVEVNGAERRPDGNYLYGAYGDAFRTSDGRWVMVVAITDRQWAALLEALGATAAVTGAAAAAGFPLDTEQGRYAARELVSACLRPWFARRSLAEVAAVLTPTPVLWGVYRSVAQMLAEDPRCSPANPMFAHVQHPGIGTLLTGGSPIGFGAAPRVPPGVAPRLGEHTREVLAAWGGLAAEDITALAASGLLGKGGLR